MERKTNELQPLEEIKTVTCFLLLFPLGIGCRQHGKEPMLPAFLDSPWELCSDPVRAQRGFLQVWLVVQDAGSLPVESRAAEMSSCSGVLGHNQRW